jgi:NAD(P)-dependent dehydrogenase (short-subunit alcohol dehydrogenase family)
MASQLVWLITGTSYVYSITSFTPSFNLTHVINLNRSGLGRQLALEALERGEKVIATGRARSIDKLDDLKARGADIVELDVTSPLETLHEAAKKAIAIHGRIDVLVNNAGEPSGSPLTYSLDFNKSC